MSKRNEARDAFAMWIVAAASPSYINSGDRTSDGIRSVVDLIIDAAKEEIRAELAEVKAEREAAGKPVD